MIESLDVRARSCTACALSHTRTQVVVGSGSLEARVALVGEAPGRSEDEGGEPFIGRSGRLLFDLLAEIDIARDDCFVTNVVKCRPPKNRPPTRGEIGACRPWWDEQRAALKAAVVVTLGNTATRAVLSRREGIGELHGRAVALDDRWVVPTYHPAAALRGGNSVVAVMREDLATVAALLRGRS